MRPTAALRFRPAPRRPRRVVAAMLAVLVLAGCYRHTPADVRDLAPNQRVRAHLRPAGAERVAQAVGAPHAVIDAQLVRVEDERIALLVPSAYLREGMRAEALYQEVHFPVGEVAALQRRELDRTRTALAAGSAAVVAGFLLYQTLAGGTETGIGGPGGGGPPEIRLPLGGVRLP